MLSLPGATAVWVACMKKRLTPTVFPGWAANNSSIKEGACNVQAA